MQKCIDVIYDVGDKVYCLDFTSNGVVIRERFITSIEILIRHNFTHIIYKTGKAAELRGIKRNQEYMFKTHQKAIDYIRNNKKGDKE